MPRNRVSFKFPRPVVDPDLRIVLFHHAGGSHTVFRPWLDYLPSNWEAVLVVTEGREMAHEQARGRGLVVLRDAIVDGLAELTDRPYAFFGHSMGGLLAFAVSLAVGDVGLPAPRWLGVSGHPGPPYALGAAPTRMHHLPDAELRDALDRLGGLPHRVLRDPMLWSRVEPIVRSDLWAAETWRLENPDAVVPCPLSVFCGDDDPVAGPDSGARWARHVNRFLGTRVFPGGHFYFAADPAPITAQIARDVEAVTGVPARWRDWVPSVVNVAG